MLAILIKCVNRFSDESDLIRANELIDWEGQNSLSLAFSGLKITLTVT